jgi:hypothetical protein
MFVPQLVFSLAVPAVTPVYDDVGSPDLDTHNGMPLLKSSQTNYV